MMKFVENPNLPVCADIVIIGEKYCNILQNGIKSLGINALFMPDNPMLIPDYPVTPTFRCCIWVGIGCCSRLI